MLFPEYDHRPHVDANLNDLSKAWAEEHPVVDGLYRSVLRRSPHLHPARCQQMIQQYHRRTGASWSLGGWMEDRSHVWYGSYMKNNNSYIHLGVDYNVPAGTSIVFNEPVKLVHHDDDKDLRGGWGPRMFLAFADRPQEDCLLILAHLAARTRRHMEEILGPDQVIAAGTEIARVGPPEVNGGWYPHLHAQLVRRDLFHSLMKRRSLQELDGYCSESDEEAAREQYPHPGRVIQLDTPRRIG